MYRSCFARRAASCAFSTCRFRREHAVCGGGEGSERNSVLCGKNIVLLRRTASFRIAFQVQRGRIIRRCRIGLHALCAYMRARAYFFLSFRFCSRLSSLFLLFLDRVAIPRLALRVYAPTFLLIFRTAGFFPLHISHNETYVGRRAPETSL